MNVNIRNDIDCFRGESVLRIALSDLLPYVQQKEVFADGKITEELGDILHSLGFDIDKGLGVDVGLCRTLHSKIPSVNVIIVGWERCDRQWMNSGKASVQAHIGRNKDSYLRGMLYSLSGQSMKQTEGLNAHKKDITHKNGDLTDKCYILNSPEEIKWQRDIESQIEKKRKYLVSIGVTLLSNL